ncbi:MAG: hypothetical protein ACMXYG_03705 [Candidatus Woesearchaeota archaeon]
MDWLKEGPLTRISDLVREHAEKVKVYDIGQMIDYINKLPTIQHESYKPRTAHEVLQEGISSDIDRNTLFRALMIANGEPASYVQAGNREFVFDNDGEIHTYVRLKGHTDMIIDTTKEYNVYFHEFQIFPNIIINEGLDLLDMQEKQSGRDIFEQANQFKQLKLKYEQMLDLWYENEKGAIKNARR